MIRYSPSPVPEDAKDLPAYLRKEFERMSRSPISKQVLKSPPNIK